MDFQEQIEKIIKADEHKYDCTAWGEGQLCCLEKEVTEKLLHQTKVDLILDVERKLIEGRKAVDGGAANLYGYDKAVEIVKSLHQSK